MSGGRSARFGFYFSDLHVIRRVLEDLVRQRAANIEGCEVPPLRTLTIESAISADGAPDWDILEEVVGQPLVIEEVKSGSVTAKDRRELWRRIRKTAALRDKEKGGPVRLVPRLTVRRQEKPIAHRRLWEILPSIVGTTQHARKHKRPSSATAFAEDALHYLTCKAKDSEQLTLERARGVLSEFQFHDSTRLEELESEVTQLIELLSKEVATEVIFSQLLGDITQKGSSTSTVSRALSAKETEKILGKLQRLHEIDPDDARLWQSWSKDSTPPEPTITMQDKPRLPYQDWREVQPEAAAALKDSSSRLLALIGRGGLGKSVLLRKLLEEARTIGDRTLWLTGDALRGVADRVGQILSLGAWATAIKGQKLRVFIDGFENAAPDNEGLKKLVAALEAIGRTCDATVALSVRDTSWSGLAGTQMKLEQWTEVRLRDWDEARVASLVRYSQRPQLSSELMRLLSTPLLLDLFLRTFGLEEAVPDGLQTQHGVLREYWERRVLPHSKQIETVARRSVLIQCCEAEASGNDLPQLTDSAMQQLASEGLFTEQRGYWYFRHPLLRDFALMEWIIKKGGDARNIISRLEGIPTRLKRWGVLRAIFEAASDNSSSTFPSVRIEELISMMQDSGLLMNAAEALGEMEGAFSLNMDGLLNPIHEPERAAAFVDRLLESARLSSNASWLDWLASLPPNSDWPQRTHWVSNEFLSHACELLEVTRSRAESSVASAVALRLRSWSADIRFSNQLSRLQFKIIPLVSELQPTQETMDWLSRHANQTIREGILDALPLLISKARESNQVLDNKLLVELYCQAAELRRDTYGLRNDDSAPSLSLREYCRTQIAMLGYNSRHQGLLRLAPEVFLPIAFDMLSGLADDEHLENDPETSDVISDPGRKSLFDDTRCHHYGSTTSDERDHIISAIRHLIRRHLDEHDDFIREVYWPAAQASRSALSWLLLLEFLADAPSSKPILLDEILSSNQLYYAQNARYFLHLAISNHWPHLSKTTRGLVLEHIQSTARRPEGVAPLASAIPEADRPTWAQSAIDWYQKHQWDPKPRRPGSDLHGSPSIYQPCKQPAADSFRDMPLWAKVASWTQAALHVDPENEAPLREALSDIKAALASGLPPADKVIKTPQLLEIICKIFRQAQYRTQVGMSQPECFLTAEEVQQLVHWGLDVARHCDIRELESNGSPIKASHAPSVGGMNAWVFALEFLSTVLSHPAVRDDSSLNRQLFTEIERRTASPSPALVWYIFSYIKPAFWFQPGSAGRDLFNRLVPDRVRDPGALTSCLPHVWYAGADERERICRFWLADHLVLPAGGDVEGFTNELGIFLGEVALIQEKNGEPNNLRRLINELLASPPTGGLLALPPHFQQWAVSVIFGAKKHLIASLKSPPHDKLRDYCLLVNDIWARMGTQPSSQQSSKAVALIFHPLHVLIKKNSEESRAIARRFWPLLEPLAKRIVREEQPNAVSALIYNLEKAAASVIGERQLMVIVEELDARAKHLGAQMNELPAELGYSWLYVYAQATEMLFSIAQLPDATPESKDRLFTIFQSWADMKIPGAIEKARAIRNSRG